MPGAVFDKYAAAIVSTTFLWGTFWIPLRYLDQVGQQSIWITSAGMWLPFFLALPYLVRRRAHIIAAGLPLVGLAISFAIASSLYAEGALRGNVARVILLFYLTPVWSTLLARWFLNQPITRQRLATLVLGLSGMTIILGENTALPVPNNLPEWLGLLAGIFWGIAMVFVQRCRNIPLMDATAAAAAAYALVFTALALIPGGRHWALEPGFVTVSVLGCMVAFALIWNLPTIALTLFGAAHVEPGKVSILLMLEVIIGLFAATVIFNEPFGLRELIGAVLIITAGITEFMPIRNTSKNLAD